MTQRIALVAADGRIENVIVAGEGYTPPAGLTAVPDEAGMAEPGGTWDGTTFAPLVPPPVPPEARRAIAKTAIYRRATDEELALLDATLPTLPLRDRLLWQDAEGGTVWVDEVASMFAAVVGEARAAELLAPG
jgi:hypothetical protein